MPETVEIAEGIRALSVTAGDYVLLTLPLSYDRDAVDRLAFQVRRSWPGLDVLIVAGDIEVAVVSREERAGPEAH